MRTITGGLAFTGRKKKRINVRRTARKITESGNELCSCPSLKKRGEVRVGFELAGERCFLKERVKKEKS